MRMFVRIAGSLVLIATAGLLGFALFSDLPAPESQVDLPVVVK